MHSIPVLRHSRQALVACWMICASLIFFGLAVVAVVAVFTGSLQPFRAIWVLLLLSVVTGGVFSAVAPNVRCDNCQSTPLLAIVNPATQFRGRYWFWRVIVDVLRHRRFVCPSCDRMFQVGAERDVVD